MGTALSASAGQSAICVPQNAARPASEVPAGSTLSNFAATDSGARGLAPRNPGARSQTMWSLSHALREKRDRMAGPRTPKNQSVTIRRRAFGWRRLHVCATLARYRFAHRASVSARVPETPALDGGCCTNPRRGRWIACKGGLRNRPSHPSSDAGPSRRRRTQPL
jgi:hypothetical protein